MKVGDRVVVVYCPRAEYGKSELGWTGVVSPKKHLINGFIFVEIDGTNKVFSYEIKQLVLEKVYNSKLYKALK